MNGTRAPPQGPPPSYAFVTRVYKRNLRPVVIAVTLISAIWALFAAISNFRSASVLRDEGASLLATLGIVSGALFAGICLIDSFGLFAAVTQRLALVRIYAYLSLASALFVFGSGVLRVVVHFTQKRSIIDTCTGLTEGRRVITYPWGFWGPSSRDFIDREDAIDWCNRLWNRDSASDVIYMIFTIFLAIFYVSLGFGYYRQLLDPTSAANVTRTPINPNFVAPSHYNPAYNASVPNLGYGYNMPYAGGPPPNQYPGYTGPGFAPPAGPPPPQQRDLNKPDHHVGGDGTAGATYHADDPFADFEDTGRRPATGNDHNNNRV